MKKLKLGIGLVMVIVLGCWIASRWHTWFVEEDEEAYVVSSSPVHVLLTFGDAQPLSRNVSWQADSVLRSSWLELVCLADSDTIRVEAQGEVFRSRGGQARISGDTLTLAAYEVYHHSLCDSLQIIKEKDITKIIE